MSANRPTRLFYGYVIVVASFFIGLLVWGAFNSFGVFFEPIRSDFGWNRATVSGMTSIAFFLMGAFSIFTGRMTDRFGPRILVAIYGLILGTGYFILARANMLWQFYLCYGILIGLGSSCADASALPTVARWFVRSRGLMSAIVKVGTGAGIFVMPLVCSCLIVRYDWHYAFSVLATMLAVGIVAGALFLRRDPEEKGLLPYGASIKGSSSHNAGGGYTLREALRSRQLWTVCTAYFLVWYCTQTITVHIVPRALDLKMSVAGSAGIISLIGAVSIVGRLAIGLITDRWGSRRALTIAMSILTASLVWLLFAGQPWMLYPFAVVYGFAHGAFFALMSPLIAEFFGIKSHGSIFGILLFLGQTGGAIGAVVSGYIFDLSHSYQIAFIILLAASIIGLTLSLILKPTFPGRAQK